MSAAIVLVLRLLVAAALFAFLTFALWTIWMEVRRDAERATRQQIPPLRLKLGAAGNKPVLRAFSQPEVLVGRDPLADVSLNDEAVSGRHALLSHHHGQWWLEDLASTNGTRLNGETVVGPTVLASEDEITCGQVHLVVTLPRGVDEPPSSTAGGEDD